MRGDRAEVVTVLTGMARGVVALTLAAAMLAATPSSAATIGSCEANADTLIVSTKDDKPRVFELTAEYDPDTGKYASEQPVVVTNGTTVVTNMVTVTNFVYYFKMTCKRSQEYTVWLENANSAEIRIDSIEPAEPPEDSETYEPEALFDEATGNWGTMWFMDKDSWSTDDPDDMDPASWNYIIRVEGQGGDSATIHYVQANALPEGIEENPARIGAIVNETSAEIFPKSGYKTFVTNEYSFWFSAEMKGGRRYVFATEGVDAGNRYELSFGDGKVTRYAPWATTGGNDAQSYDPEEDETSGIQVSGFSTNFPNGKVRLKYKLIPARTIEQHNPKPIEVDGDAVSFKTGRINAMGTEIYDRIIDNNLFSFEAKKDVRYVAETQGAVSNVLIRLYDKTGKVIGTSHSIGDGTENARLGFTVASDATYYIGVAQNLKDDDFDELEDQTVTFTVETVSPKFGDPDDWDDADDEVAGAALLSPVPCQDWGIRTPDDMDKAGHGWHRLGKHDWYDTFAICARAGLTYTLTATLESASVRPTTSLEASAFYFDNKTQRSARPTGTINPTSVNPFSHPFQFTADHNGIYYVRIRVAQGLSLDYPAHRIHIMASDQGFPYDGLGYGLKLAAMKVYAKGYPAATWTLNSEKVAYPNGATIVLPLESYDDKTKKYQNLSYTVKFAKLKGFRKPDDVKPTLKAWAAAANIVTAYTDTFDPKDDTASGATGWAVKAKESVNARTFWAEDPADNFALTGKDGTYFDFSLAQQSEADDGSEPDAVFTISNGGTIFCENVTEVSKLHLPSSKAKYILAVMHKNPKKPVDTSYSISGVSADVGAIKFAKNAVSVKENAPSVTLTVNRTAKAGRLVVNYTTKDGTAKAGDKYYAQSGTLVWEDGDNKAKTITVKLIPDIVGYYHGYDRSFSVVLSDAGTGDYPAKFPAGDTATVTLGESQSSAAKNTIASAYKPIAAKGVSTAAAPLRSGTFFGVAAATGEGVAPSSGLSQLASVNVTVASKGGADSISAKVQVGGKAYAFKSDAKTPVEWSDAGDGRITATVETGGNTISLTVADGDTTDASAWKKSGGSVRVVVAGVVYGGDVFRDNSKIDAFLKAVVNFVGYYTVALAPRDLATGAAVEPGNLPAGSGYLTVTVDNGGKAKGAGLLADGTKVALSAPAAALLADSGSSTGYAMYVPVYSAKSPYCFGGLLKFTATDAVNGDGRKTAVVDGAASELAWFNDNTALSASGKDALAYGLFPVGGFYDTVERLQRHYFDRGGAAFAVDTVGVDELPDAVFRIGGTTYSTRVATQQADGSSVDLAIDAFSTAKKALVTDSQKKVDFAASVNPANVQVKIARATGLVSGSFSIWAESASGSQKEIAGAKHYGVALLSCGELPADGAGSIDASTATAGFFNLPVTLSSRKWTYSAPFNIKAKVE